MLNLIIDLTNQTNEVKYGKLKELIYNSFNLQAQNGKTNHTQYISTSRIRELLHKCLFDGLDTNYDQYAPYTIINTSIKEISRLYFDNKLTFNYINSNSYGSEDKYAITLDWNDIK